MLELIALATATGLLLLAWGVGPGRCLRGGSGAIRDAGVQERSKLEDELSAARSELAEKDAILDALTRGLGLKIQVVNRDLKTTPDEAAPPESKGTSAEGDAEGPGSGSAGERRVEEIVTQRDPGSLRYYEVVSSDVGNDRGDVGRVTEIVRDVTERSKFEVQLLQAGKMAALGELAAGIAHEINNPLASISAYAEQLEVAAAKPALATLPEFRKFPGHLAKIRRNVKRCKEITNALLAFGRPRGHVRDTVDVARAIDETLSLIAYEARSADKTIERDIGPGLPAVSCNKGEVQQVFLNLATNALDVTPPGGKIRVRASLQGSFVNLEVEDEGPGIPEEHRSEIFSPFFTTKPSDKGIGLGLAICSRLVERMKGQLEFRTGSSGTTFSVRLPTFAAKQQEGR